jgi:hypothetical protein
MARVENIVHGLKGRNIMIIIQIYEISILSVLHKINELLHFNKLEKKYAPALDNYGQSCFVRSDLKKNEVCL